MRKFLIIAALLVTTSSLAQAGDTFSFQVNGQRVKITRPSNCTALSCINISAPGLMDSKSDDTDTSADTTTPAPQTQAAAPVQAPVQAPAQVQAAAPAPAGQAAVGTVPPLPTQTNSTGNVTTLPAPTSTDTQTQQTVAAPAVVPNQVVASAPTQPQQPVAQPAPVQQALANGPLGIWMTEKNEGKVHVVNCGANLCGYAVSAKTGADGEQVLINMKPSSEGGWKGRIKDTRGGGGVYDSTIAMRGDNKMRVQGCAFGGMFCGGQTWTRAN